MYIRLQEVIGFLLTLKTKGCIVDMSLPIPGFSIGND